MRFLVAGEALVDLVQSRTDGRFTAHAGGSPFNVAITLGRLGEQVLLAGQGGDDAFGALLAERLGESGVLLDCWRTLPLPTSVAVAALDERGAAGYRFYFDGTAGLAAAGMPPPPEVAVLHAGSIASWLAPSAPVVQSLMSGARACGRTLVSYDPNVRPALMPDVAAARVQIERCIGSAHVVKVSDEDLALLYGDASLDETAAACCRRGASLVVVTRGAAGALAFGPHGPIAECAAPKITVADTVGAGDSFAGGLLSALAADGLAAPAALHAAAAAGDARIADALHTAVTVAAITCERPGADPPTAAELATRVARLPG
jgi:fructokinase